MTDYGNAAINLAAKFAEEIAEAAGYAAHTNGIVLCSEGEGECNG
jgi:hypothetical protein